MSDILSNLKAEHGYTEESDAVRWLAEVLEGYSVDERRLFLRFVTGSVGLPVGGLAGLDPPFSVVRRDVSTDRLCADETLPSSNTCMHILKLPCYSSRDVLQSRLMTALRDGQSSFHLS